MSLVHRLSFAALGLALALGASACSGKSDTSAGAGASASPAAPDAANSAASTAAPTDDPHAEHIRIVTTKGTIVAVLDAAHAPKTVANFNHYIDAKFFNGGTFFRAIPGFVIQGGNKPKESAKDIGIPLEDPQTTGLRNERGSLAMARTSDPNSATSEFFIDVGQETALDGGNGSPGYAVFGHVVSGMNVVDAIVAGPAQEEMLLVPIKIVSISRVK